MDFGRLETKTVLHRMLRRYRMELAAPATSRAGTTAGMPIPMDGMPIVLRKL